MSADEYSSMTVAALKDALKQRELPTTGKKADLVKRLQDADNDKAAPAADVDAAAAGPTEAAVVADTAVPASAGGVTVAPTDPAAADKGDDPVSKRVARFGSAVLREDEKAKMREARFKPSNPAVDASKLEERAARFGIETEESRKKKEAARARRFQLDTPEILAEKKRAREERFQKPVPEVTKQVPLEELAALIKKKT